jgi:hypothetical protein
LIEVLVESTKSQNDVQNVIVVFNSEYIRFQLLKASCSFLHYATCKRGFSLKVFIKIDFP